MDRILTALEPKKKVNHSSKFRQLKKMALKQVMENKSGTDDNF